MKERRKPQTRRFDWPVFGLLVASSAIMVVVIVGAIAALS